MTLVVGLSRTTGSSGLQLEASDGIIRETDKMLAEAIRAGQGLYADGFLEKPTDWKYVLDLLQFYVLVQ